jgi:hypothetical protein
VSFLIDPPWLYANGQAYARFAPQAERRAPARALATATVGTFWLVSVSMYLNLPWTEPLARACRAADGRDWMLNSGVFRLDPKAAGPATHVLAALVFLTYPLWLVLGYRRGLRVREAQG